MEGQMETKEAILAAGTEAVKIYREISGCRQDNEVPEMFIIFPDGG